MDREQAEKIIEQIRANAPVEGRDFRWEDRDGRRVRVMLRYPDAPTVEQIEAMQILGML